MKSAQADTDKGIAPGVLPHRDLIAQATPAQLPPQPDYKITVNAQVDPISTLFVDGNYDLPVTREGPGGAGQYFRRSAAMGDAVQRLRAMLRTPGTEFADKAKAGPFWSFIGDPTRSSQADLIYAQVTDRWGSVAGGAIVSGYAAFAADETAKSKHPRDLLIIAQTDQAHAKSLEKLKLLGKENLNVAAKTGLNVLSWFSDDKKELNEVVEIVATLTPLLQKVEIHDMWNKNLLEAAILFRIEPGDLSSKDAKRVEEVIRAYYAKKLTESKK